MEEREISKAEAKEIVTRPESHFWDFKSKKIDGKTLQKTVVAMLNADGGDIAVGIENPSGSIDLELWDGFPNLEATNQLNRIAWLVIHVLTTGHDKIIVT